MIALDTHALVWWTLEPARLGARARRAIAAADRVGVPAIVFWEVAMLARRKRVNLGTSIAEWTRDVLSLARVEPLSLTADIAVAAENLSMHQDPADRFIVATALHHGCVLVTKDVSIRDAAVTAVVW